MKDENNIIAYTKWLQTLGYSNASIYYLPKHVTEFYKFLKDQRVVGQTKITQKNIDAYFEYLSNRPNQRQDGGLSLNYLQKQKSALKLYLEYLRKQQQIHHQINFPHFDKITTTPMILTIKEARLLFESCPDTILGKRNAVILVLYYSCGLRKSEGLNLKTTDIDLQKRQIFIRKSKTHRQRHVPISKKSLLIIENYLQNARELLLPPKSTTTAFLVSDKGRPLSKEQVPKILKKLIQKTNNKTLENKNITLHKLRHSIATHLLANQMSLENIALFLGHKSLDSTQIYTHLVKQDTT
jgi:integrase/recombinase XerD